MQRHFDAGVPYGQSAADGERELGDDLRRRFSNLDRNHECEQPELPMESGRGDDDGEYVYWRWRFSNT